MVDLEGRAMGIAVARAGRIKSFIIPGAAVRALLKEEPMKPAAPELVNREDDEFEGEDPFEVMRRKMEEMRRLMEEIEEMEK